MVDFFKGLCVGLCRPVRPFVGFQNGSWAFEIRSCQYVQAYTDIKSSALIFELAECEAALVQKPLIHLMALCWSCYPAFLTTYSDCPGTGSSFSKFREKRGMQLLTSVEMTFFKLTFQLTLQELKMRQDVVRPEDSIV